MTIPYDIDDGGRRFGESPLHHVRSCTVHCWKRWPQSHGSHGMCCRCRTVKSAATVCNHAERNPNFDGQYCALCNRNVCSNCHVGEATILARWCSDCVPPSLRGPTPSLAGFLSFDAWRQIVASQPGCQECIFDGARLIDHCHNCCLAIIGQVWRHFQGL